MQQLHTLSIMVSNQAFSNTKIRDKWTSDIGAICHNAQVNHDSSFF